MSLTFIRYYLFKDAIRFIHSNITYMQDTSNQSLFKYALFYDAQDFYKLMSFYKIDPYQLSDKIKNNFPSFLKECMQNAYMHASLKEQLFCYYLFLSYLTDQYFTPFVDAFCKSVKKKIELEKTLETYFFNKNEGLFLHKIDIADYFFASFELTPEDIHLIEKPMKRLFGFFRTEAYYQECYKTARVYFDHFAISKTGIKKPLFKLYDIFLNHRKGKRKAITFLYPKKIDTSVLNLSKTSYTFRETIVSYTIEEVYSYMLKEARRVCEILNSYFTENQNIKPFYKYFHIEKD